MRTRTMAERTKKRMKKGMGCGKRGQIVQERARETVVRVQPKRHETAPLAVCDG